MGQSSSEQLSGSLRIFTGEDSYDDLDHLEAVPLQKVSVNAGELFELLQDAVSTNRAWLTDFSDDTVEVPQDLYEVLIAYKRLVYRKAA